MERPDRAGRQYRLACGSFADRQERAFCRENRLLGCGEGLKVHTRREALDRFYVLYNIAKPLNGIARRHAQSRGSRFSRHEAQAFLPRLGRPDGRPSL